MAQTINIQRLWDQKYRDESVPFPIDGALATAGIFNVLDHAAAGNGVTDDTAAIQATINLAQAVGGTVTSPPGYTFLVSANLNVSASCVLDFSNATIKRSVAWVGDFLSLLNVTNGTVTVKNVTLDGNRANGPLGGGAALNGSGVVATFQNVRALHNRKWGFIVVNGATLDAYDCVASDNFSGDATADGFVCSSSGLLRTYDCTADLNERGGFTFVSGSADKCRLEGSASFNGTGAIIGSNLGSCPSFLAEGNNAYGINQTGASWNFGSVTTNATGIASANYAQNNAGTGVELFAGADHCKFQAITSNGNLGYAVAVAGAHYCSIGTMIADHESAVDNDPALSITDSNHTYVGTLRVVSYTIAMEVGGSTASQYGMVDSIFSTDCGFGVVVFNLCSYWHVGRIVSRQNWNVTLGLSTVSDAVVVFGQNGTCDHIEVGFVDHFATGTPPANAQLPKYVIDGKVTSNNCRVRGYWARGFATAGALDSGTGNVFTAAT